MQLLVYEQYYFSLHYTFLMLIRFTKNRFCIIQFRSYTCFDSCSSSEKSRKINVVIVNYLVECQNFSWNSKSYRKISTNQCSNSSQWVIDFEYKTHLFAIRQRLKNLRSLSRVLETKIVRNQDLSIDQKFTQFSAQKSCTEARLCIFRHDTSSKTTTWKNRTWKNEKKNQTKRDCVETKTKNVRKKTF